LSAPAGICLGIFVKEEANPIIVYVLAGITSGSFLYLGINEILMNGLKDKKNKFTNIFLYMLGLTLIIVMLMLFGVEHAHEDEHADEHADEDDHHDEEDHHDEDDHHDDHDDDH